MSQWEPVSSTKSHGFIQFSDKVKNRHNQKMAETIYFFVNSFCQQSLVCCFLEINGGFGGGEWLLHWNLDLLFGNNNCDNKGV